MESITVTTASRPKKDHKKALQRFLRTMFKRRVVIIGAIGTLFFVLVAIFAPLICNVANVDPYEICGASLQDPSAEHILGTDYIGRDSFARIVYGARVSLTTGVIATLIGAAIGTLLGMCAAYFGGIVDKILIAYCETFNSIPFVALCLTLVALIGSSMFNMAVIMAIMVVPGFLRMMRASSLTIMGTDYILAARLSGQAKFLQLLIHVLPNAISPIIVMCTQMVGTTIMMESGLSFLGVGISVPTASWGSIINEARPYLIMKPVYVLAPCACLAVLIISLNLLGDGIRDALDPTLRGES